MHFENTCTQLRSRTDCSNAEFADYWCDLEGERRIANWKTRDALTKHLKFVEFHRGQLAALMPVATCVVAVVISTLTGLLN